MTTTKIVTNITAQIILKTSQDVKDFVFKTSSLPKDVQVKVMYDDCVVDGKSILGLLSINTKGILTVKILSNKTPDVQILKAIKPWILKYEERIETQ